MPKSKHRRNGVSRMHLKRNGVSRTYTRHWFDALPYKERLAAMPFLVRQLRELTLQKEKPVQVEIVGLPVFPSIKFKE